MGDVKRGVIAWRVWQTAGTIRRELQNGGAGRLDEAWGDLAVASQDEVRSLTERLEDGGVEAMLLGDVDYPAKLAEMRSPPPVIFARGNLDLLERRAVGVCGSRDVSEEGLIAARALATSIAGSGDTLIAGNAQGVDAEAQGTALEAGGTVITALPEGITHFRLRSGSIDAEPASDRLLALSEFPPLQPWSVGGAMTRNELIVGLATALVVIEAGERGGTLAAGEAALKVGRPVIALEYGSGTPPGNLLLLRRGAVGAASPREVYEVIDSVVNDPPTKDAAAQLPLAF